MEEEKQNIEKEIKEEKVVVENPKKNMAGNKFGKAIPIIMIVAFVLAVINLVLSIVNSKPGKLIIKAESSLEEIVEKMI